MNCRPVLYDRAFFVIIGLQKCHYTGGRTYGSEYVQAERTPCTESRREKESCRSQKKGCREKEQVISIQAVKKDPIGQCTGKIKVDT